MEVIKAGYSKESYLIHLLWCIFFVTAFYEITRLPTHIPGMENRAADAISRNLSTSPGRSSSSGDAPRSNTATDSAMPRLNISSLGPVVQKMFTVGVAPSTKKAYGSGGR